MFWRTDEYHRMVYMSPHVVSAVDIIMKDQLGKTRAELADDDLDSSRWKNIWQISTDIAPTKTFATYGNVMTEAFAISRV